MHPLGLVVLIASVTTACYVTAAGRMLANRARHEAQLNATRALLEIYANGVWRSAPFAGVLPPIGAEDTLRGWHNRPDVRRAYESIGCSPGFRRIESEPPLVETEAVLVSAPTWDEPPTDSTLAVPAAVRPPILVALP